jgi:hypothetical protein
MPSDPLSPLPDPALPGTRPAESIAELWGLLHTDPLAPSPWRSLADAYAAARLAPQWAYATAQWRRFQGAPDPHPIEAPFPWPPDPSPALADSWLLHPHGSDAQRWLQGLETWLVRCPGDWLSWLYLARLQDGSTATTSVAALCRAETLEPIAGESRHWLGIWRLNGGDAAAAVEALTPLVNRQPPRYGSLLQLGLALLRCGNRSAAEAAFTRASTSSHPGFLRLLAQRVYEHNYWQEAIAELHRRLCAPIEAAVRSHPPASFANSRDPERLLRVGLVSGDFHRQHPINLFMLPLLERLDPQQISVAVFHTGAMHDEYTARASRAANDWIESASLDDATLQRRIVAAGIDVLIDLAGHTSNHRLGVFALRAAPVQATFLGYPHSTGLSRIDWLIGDPEVSPAEHAHLFSEGIAQLPSPVFCWSPVDNYPLPPPRPEQAPLVFGSFNTLRKVSTRTLRLWAALLRDLPEARLLLKAPSLRDASARERIAHLFRAEGIDRGRLILEGPEELGQMMQRYGGIDIALDPTPYNGGTTTLQALWMGVPVICLRGGNFVSRMGASFLTALGQSDWIAEDEEQYRASARRLADQLPDLRRGRAALRERMARSGLSDLDRYAAAFQRLLRRMWRHHCEGSRVRLLPAES